MTPCVTWTLHNYEACGWEHCLSVTLSLAAADKLAERLSPCPPPWCHFSCSPALRLSRLTFLLSLAVMLSLFVLHPVHFFVSSNCSVMTRANISLQLVRDWVHLFLWFKKLRAVLYMCVCVCMRWVQTWLMSNQQERFQIQSWQLIIFCFQKYFLISAKFTLVYYYAFLGEGLRFILSHIMFKPQGYVSLSERLERRRNS